MTNTATWDRGLCGLYGAGSILQIFAFHRSEIPLWVPCESTSVVNIVLT